MSTVTGSSRTDGNATASVDLGEAGLDDEDLVPRKAVLEDVLEDDTADVPLFGDPDDPDRLRAEETADRGDRPRPGSGCPPGEPAQTVQGNEPSVPDDERIDLEFLEDVG